MLFDLCGMPLSDLAVGVGVSVDVELLFKPGFVDDTELEVENCFDEL